MRTGDDGCHSGLAKERSGGERRGCRAGANHDQSVAGDDSFGCFAGAVIGAAVVIDLKLDAGRFATGVGLVGREAHGIDHRQAGGLARSRLRHDYRDFYGALRERRR